MASSGSTGARIARKGIPLCIAEWWAVITVPFVKVGTPVGDVVCEVTWTAAEAPS